MQCSTVQAQAGRLAGQDRTGQGACGQQLLVRRVRKLINESILLASMPLLSVWPVPASPACQTGLPYLIALWINLSVGRPPTEARRYIIQPDEMHVHRMILTISTINYIGYHWAYSVRGPLLLCFLPKCGNIWLSHHIRSTYSSQHGICLSPIKSYGSRSDRILGIV